MCFEISETPFSKLTELCFYVLEISLNYFNSHLTFHISNEKDTSINYVFLGETKNVINGNDLLRINLIFNSA